MGELERRVDSVLLHPRSPAFIQKIYNSLKNYLRRPSIQQQQRQHAQ